MPQHNSRATTKTKQKHVALTLGVLAFATIFCVVVGMGRQSLDRSLQILLLSIGAGVAAVCAIWLMRHSWHSSQAAPLSSKPLRITAAAALGRAGGYGVCLAFCLFRLASGLKTSGLSFDWFEATFPYLFFAWIFGPRLGFHIRLFRKARRDGTLVIVPAQLPPGEKANLRLGGVISDLKYAVPATELVRINDRDRIMSQPTQEYESVFPNPVVAEAAQSVTVSSS